MGFGYLTMGRNRAAIIGAGTSGVSAAKLLAERGYDVTVFDQSKDTLPEGIRATIHQVEDPAAMGEAITALDPKFLVVSPGVPPHSKALEAPTASGVEVIGEVELAWRLGNQRDWLCITGTNGKTTTVEMLASILRAGGEDVVASGNVGFPLTEPKSMEAERLPVELSSAQLTTTTTLAPASSICLNVDVDHVDWHGSKEAYWDAKASVYDNTSVARIYFADDPQVKSWAEQASNAASSALLPLSFGEVDEGGIGIQDGHLINRFSPAAGPEGGPTVVDLRDVALLSAGLAVDHGVGSVVVRDALAAAALAISVGVSLQVVHQGLLDFNPQQHRLAPAGTAQQRTFVDDSKATNVHAALAALNSFDKSRLIWIVGGDTKGQDLSPLIREVGSQVKGVVVIGADPSDLLDALAVSAPTTPVQRVVGIGRPEEWMGEVVRASMEMSAPGDTVLLAPACASWDQFESYAQRGDLFTQEVKSWGSTR